MNTTSMTRTAAVTALIIGAIFAGGCSKAEESSSSAVALATTAPPILSTTVKVPGIGEVVLDEVVAGKYQQMGGAAILGPPTGGQPQRVADGTVQTFANGNIYSSPSTGPHLVWGEILKTYLAEGGPAGPLGLPTTDEFEVDGGPRVAHGGWGGEFENGYIWWLRLSSQSNQFESYITKK